MKFQFQFTESNLVSIRAWEIETHKSVVSIRCMGNWNRTESWIVFFNLPNHEISIYRTTHLPNHWVSVYRIIEFQFTDWVSIYGFYRITEFQFTESLSFNLPNHLVSIYGITEFQFTESLSFNLPNHLVSIYPNHLVSIYPNHVVSIYRKLKLKWFGKLKSNGKLK